MKKTLEHYETIAQEIISAIEKGVCAFQKNWDASELRNRTPYNPLTKRTYNGLNLLRLNLSGYEDPRWLTYKQAQIMGASVKKGAKSKHIIFASPYIAKQDKTSQTDEQNEENDQDQTSKKIFFGLANVFNAQDISGLPPFEPNVNTKDIDFNSMLAAKKVLEDSKAVIQHKLIDSAYYSPSADKIILPKQRFFHSEKDYYATAFHELSHWSGHPKRLNRLQDARFGSKAYAIEELNAEIGAYMLSAKYCVDFTPKNHEAYIANWLKVLKNNPKEIYKAASTADKIVKYIESLSPTLEQTKSQNKFVYFEVPFKDKERAKDLGAKWDKENKSWYAKTQLAPKLKEHFKINHTLENTQPKQTQKEAEMMRL